MKPKLIALIGSFCLLFALFVPTNILAQTKFSFDEVSKVSKSEVIDGDYFAAGERIDIDGEVVGDVYVAGGRIVVNGVIHGDLLVAAGQVDINGTVNQDVRVASGQVEVNGEVLGNITALAGTIDIKESALVGGGVVTAAGDVFVAGTVGRSIHAAVGNLTIADSASVDGDVYYTSEEDANIDSEASIAGILQKNQPPEVTPPSRKAVGGFFDGMNFLTAIFSFLATLLIGFLLLRFFPNYSQNAADVVKTQLGKSLGIGFLVAVLSPILFVLLLITLVGIPLSLALLIAIPLLMYTGRIYVFLALGQKLLPMINKDSKKVNPYYAFATGALIYYLIGIVPILGGLFKLGVVLAGLGAEVLNRKRTYLSARQAKIF